MDVSEKTCITGTGPLEIACCSEEQLSSLSTELINDGDMGVGEDGDGGGVGKDEDDNPVLAVRTLRREDSM